MNLFRPPFNRRRPVRAAAAAGLLWALGASAVESPVRLYRGEGGWAVAEGLPADAVPPSPDWGRDGALWIGRIPDGTEILDWRGTRLAVADALPLPLAPGVLPSVRNAFGSCLVRSLSVRFESQIRAHRWSLVFPPKDRPLEFLPLELAHGEPLPLALELQDAETGARWTLSPERMGREGGMFEREKGEARLYAGKVDDGRLEWHLIVVLAPSGRRILQARVQSLDGPPRRLRMRIKVRTEAPGVPVLQEELPPAVVAWRDGLAVGLLLDLAEPRRYRPVLDEPGWTGLEFDLAVTPATGNFPRSATFSLEADAWPAEDGDAARAGALERLPRFGGATPLPESVLQGGLAPGQAMEPASLTLTHPAAPAAPGFRTRLEPAGPALKPPEGFRDDEDVLRYLMLRMSGLFADQDWASSAFLCAAQSADGRPRIERSDFAARVAVNPDPDLDAMLEMGRNRGLTLLARVLDSGEPAVWIRTAGPAPGLDHHARALYLCDYPAVWDPGTLAIGVDLGHAEAELISSLGCMLRDRGIALLVEDDGPLAPFTTAHADALVCRSAGATEMRRQHALAAGRPVVWMPENPDGAARALARDLGFASPARIEQN